MEGPSSKILYGRELEQISLQVCHQNNLSDERKRVYLNIKFKNAREYMPMTFYLTTRHREHKDLANKFATFDETFIGYAHERGKNGASKKTENAYMSLTPIDAIDNTFTAHIVIHDLDIRFNFICPERLNKNQTKSEEHTSELQSH